MASVSDGGATGNDPYPPGPYGWKEGNTAPDVSFPGYRGGKAPWTSIAMHDYYDPKGTKGIRALYMPVFTAWCPHCADESAVMGPLVASYQPKGAVFLGILAENDSNGPATKATVDYWLAMYHFAFDTAIEPNALGANQFPYHVLVDPRTMKVVGADACAGDTLPCVDALIAKNQ